jgi:hypothetical protein
MADRPRDDDRPEHEPPSRRTSPLSPETTASAAVPAARVRRQGRRGGLQPDANLATRATSRGLRALNLTESEAAILATFMCGIPVGKRRWRLFELNRTLVLRALRGEGYVQGGDTRH